MCTEDQGTIDYYLVWTAKGYMRGRKRYIWRIDMLEIKEKQEFQEEMVRNAVKFSALMERVGTIDTEMERDRTKAKIIEG